VLIFPEGTRSPDGKLQPAQPGIGMIVAKTGAPVVPVRISGSYEVFSRNMKMPARGEISVAIGRPFKFAVDHSADEQSRKYYQQSSEAVVRAIAGLRCTANDC